MKKKGGVKYVHGFPVGRLPKGDERWSCEVCNKTILQPHAQGRRRTTCSDKCRAKLKRLRQKVETSRKEKQAEIRKTVKNMRRSANENAAKVVDSANHIN